MDLRLPRALKEIRKNPIRHSDRGLTKRIGKGYGDAGGMALEWRPLLEREAAEDCAGTRQSMQAETGGH